MALSNLIYLFPPTEAFTWMVHLPFAIFYFWLEELQLSTSATGLLKSSFQRALAEHVGDAVQWISKKKFKFRFSCIFTLCNPNLKYCVLIFYQPYLSALSSPFQVLTSNNYVANKAIACWSSVWSSKTYRIFWLVSTNLPVRGLFWG